MNGARPTEYVETVVIGGGQAGLSVGYHLARQGRSFVILDANQRIGDSWRLRWDSLRLFTPARFNSLDGMPFPADADYFPTKDEMGDYLEAYATRFNLPVRSGVRVDGLSKEDGRFVISAGEQRFEADNVVVAMSNYQQAQAPAFAKDLAPDVVQLHSSEYRNPSQLREGPVLIAGAGNSGAELAMEISRSHRTLLSGRGTGYIPFRIDGAAARLVLWRVLLRGLFHRVLTVRTPIGRRVRKKVLSQGGPLVRVKPRDLAAAGVERIGRIAGVSDGLPRLENGSVVDVANVIWCTGFHAGFDWIDLPIFDGQAGREPSHESGTVTAEPGLYFVGLHFLYSMSSTMIHGVGRDAERIAGAIARGSRARNITPGERPEVIGEMQASREG